MNGRPVAERLRKRLLVTGGSGYLGGWVARLAHARWDVTATFLAHPADEPGVAWQQLDVRDQAAVASLVERVHPDVVVHTAALNPGQGADFEATNAGGARHIARAAAASGARLIHVSTDVIFDGEKGRYVEEDQPNPLSPYAQSKVLAEEEVLISGAEAVIVRTSLIYGWRPTIGRQTRWILDSLQARRPVHLYTDELRCPIWVESLAAALIELAGNDYTGILHVAGAQALSRYAFGVRLMRFHGVDPSPIVPCRSRESGLRRLLDGTLDCSRARALLHTPLPGVDEVLGQ